MPEWYQHLPENIDPVAFMLGDVDVRWYSLMYIVGFLVVWMLLRKYAYREDEQDSASGGKNISREQLFDLLLWGLGGAILGGRIGYVLLYDLSYYLSHPLEVFVPYDISSGAWIGIYGMSFHGGLIGAIVIGWWYIRRQDLDFLSLADKIALVAPLGYFFGRVGNFLNHELFGRETQSVVGIYFNGVLRHPSQLYEAFLEGIVLFLVLWIIQKKNSFKGAVLSAFIVGYAVFRFLVEFFREPDAHLGFIFMEWMTMGQILSLVMMAIGVVMWYVLCRKHKSL